MTWMRGSVLCLGLILALSRPVQSQEGPDAGAGPASPNPFELMRALQRVQDQMVDGQRGAWNRLRSLTAQTGENFLAADPAAWHDPKNARAAVIYGLSGGPVRVIRHIARLGTCPEPENRLVEGALAYLDGHDEKAKEILLPVAAKTLPSATGGHVAMVQSLLVAKDDPRRALAFLDQARLLAPGTLIEETSLRRAIVLAEETGDIEKFATLSGQYLRRFRRSVYAEKFRERFPESVLRLASRFDLSRDARLYAVLDTIEAGSRLSLYLRLARSSLIAGKLESARIYADKASGLAPAGTPAASRTKLYDAAALVLKGDVEEGQNRLDGLDGALLPNPDAELRSAVSAMAGHIRSPLSPSPGRAEPSPDRTPAMPQEIAGGSALDLIDRAEKAMDAARDILQEEARP